MNDFQVRPPSLLAQPSYLTSQVSKYGRRHLEATLAEHGLALAHAAVLAALDDFGPLSQQNLSDCLDLDKSRLVKVIDDLAGQRAVTRIQDPTDRRRNQVSLTAEGQELAAAVGTAAMRSQRGFLSSLSKEEERILVALLRRVLDTNDATRLKNGNPQR